MSFEGKIFPATVAKVLDPYKIVINKGSEDGVKIGQRFLLYAISNENIIDPVNGINLGRLEIPKGSGKVIHIQDKMAILESDRTGHQQEKKIIKTIFQNRAGYTAALAGMNLPQQEEITEIQQDIKPFENPLKGDCAKPI